MSYKAVPVCRQQQVVAGFLSLMIGAGSLHVITPMMRFNLVRRHRGWRFVSLLLLLLSGWAMAVEAPLRVAGSAYWKPFTYLDEDGHPQGLLIELWQSYSRITGRPVQFMLADWQQAIDMVRDGKADVHSGLLWSAQREQWLEFGEPLAKLDTELYVSASVRTEALDSLLDDGHLGVVIGSFEEEYARTHFPKSELVLFDDNEALMQAARQGNITLLIADQQTANIYLSSDEIKTTFIPVRRLYSGQVRLAVRQGNDELLSEIDRGFMRIPQAERERIRQRWVNVETVYPSFLLPLAGIAFILTVVSYIVQLRHSVTARTAELERLNLQLQTLANTDVLTGLLNRRAFLPCLQAALEQGHGASLLLFDLDRFKGINDRFGHQMGDQVLKTVVARVREQLPASAPFGRMGGEEFMIVLGEMEQSELEAWGKRLSEAVHLAPMETAHGPLSLSISIGAVWLPVGERAEMTPLLTQVDNLMYRSKELGRNTWQVARYRQPG
ncbi:periplasmic/7TM domain sensor diguanylate cyclase [Aeromonas sp. RU39B]|uniref:transporter substrate-binding domain-containing diguanylate cyclase n=1 Tax=Aeromonas sp. RU39B TaxID=1907416 RepID=UPI000956A27C|nr:sensor domain-containing diguanylate cyclase [Aeromonas sp. RU39B]SIR22084.1 periplasmic/7TM domain sensor diguanylate cyclase [Aeromonas sp. RU39B]